MKQKLLAAALLAPLLFGTTVSAAPQTSKADSQDQKESQSTIMHQHMMGSQMMGEGMMGEMTTHHQEMSKLMNKLMESMTSMRNEKDPVALKGKMAEHEALLKEMHDQMMQQGGTMMKMDGMMPGQKGMGCPAAIGK